MRMNEKSAPLFPINTQILSSHAQVQKCGWKNLNQKMALFIQQYTSTELEADKAYVSI